jgi:hypothetical protein
MIYMCLPVQSFNVGRLDSQIEAIIEEHPALIAGRDERIAKS